MQINVNDSLTAQALSYLKKIPLVARWKKNVRHCAAEKSSSSSRTLCYLIQLVNPVKFQRAIKKRIVISLNNRRWFLWPSELCTATP